MPLNEAMEEIMDRMEKESMTRSIERYADKAMYEAAPMQREVGQRVEPKVHLLWMTPDPLAAIAAACRMYEGKPTYSLADITDEEKQHYAQQVQKTHLKAPLEFVKFHFFIEGVDRSFTHQMVRQRTAVFAQESLRFAVKHNFADEALWPPSLQAASDDIKERVQQHREHTQDLYNYLVANGIPAEDARGELPHSTSTRLNYCTDLRNLADHAGNRLCTQAQFIWRRVFFEIVRSIHDYSPEGAELVKLNLFKPVCYQIGNCPFQASFDRGCTIRDRVLLHASHGRPSSQWGDESLGDDRIFNYEWALDPKAAWVE